MRDGSKGKQRTLKLLEMQRLRKLVNKLLRERKINTEIGKLAGLYKYQGEKHHYEEKGMKTLTRWKKCMW